MKVYEARPNKEVIVVRTEKGSDEYEVWLIEPKLVGYLHRVGHQRITVNDDNIHHTNINTAVAALVRQEGITGLGVPLPSFYVKRSKYKVTREMYGYEIYEISHELLQELIAEDETLTGSAGQKLAAAMNKVFKLGKQELIIRGVPVSILSQIFPEGQEQEE